MIENHSNSLGNQRFTADISLVRFANGKHFVGAPTHHEYDGQQRGEDFVPVSPRSPVQGSTGLQRPAPALVRSRLPPTRGAAKVDQKTTSLASLSETAKRHFTPWWKGVQLVLRHYGCPRTVISSLRWQLMAFIDHDDEMAVTKHIKYVFCHYQSRYLRNVSPEAPSPWVPKGPWRRWSKSRLLGCKNTWLWYSLLQTKRATATVSEGFEIRSLIKHSQAMRLLDPVEPDQASLLMEDSEMDLLIEGLFDETVSLALDFFKRDSHLWRKPSTSASFTAPRGFGALQELRDATETRKERIPVEPIDWSELTDHNFSISSGCPFVEIDDLRFESEICITDAGITQGIYSKGKITVQMQEMLETLDDFSQTYEAGMLNCRAVAIMEPLKCRIITAGEGLPYTFARFLQKGLWQTLSKLDCFVIDGPIRATQIEDLYDPEIEDGLWHSVDYSDATDKLSANVSFKVLQSIIESIGLDGTAASICYDVLAPHQVHYKKWWPGHRLNRLIRRGELDIESACYFDAICDSSVSKLELQEGHYDDEVVDVVPENGEFNPDYWYRIKPVLQQNGQLMGSVLSFPILCVVNLLSFILAYKDIHGEFDFFEDVLRYVLVNGDDMLFYGTQELADQHARIANSIGLTLTVGKAYQSETWANFNSTCFVISYSGDGSKAYATKVDHMRSGLFFGKRKVQKDERKKTMREEVNYVSTIEEQLKGALPGKSKDLLRLIIREHSQKIREELRGRNLFIHPSLGGIGVPVPTGWSWSVTTDQLSNAFRLINKLDGYAVSAAQPLPGLLLEEHLSIPDWLTVPKADQDFTIRHPRYPDWNKETHTRSQYLGPYMLSKTQLQIGVVPLQKSLVREIISVCGIRFFVDPFAGNGPKKEHFVLPRIHRRQKDDQKERQSEYDCLRALVRALIRKKRFLLDPSPAPLF